MDKVKVYKYINLIQIIIGFLLCFIIIKVKYNQQIKFEDLALGTQTSSYLAVDKSKNPIHLFRIDQEEMNGFKKYYSLIKDSNIVLLIGNSQTHSINQQKNNQVNYVEILYKNFYPRSLFVMANSFPNANLQEMYLSYRFWKTRMNIKYVAVPLFLDDTREDGIRDVFFPYLVSTHFQIPDTSVEVNQKIDEELRSYWHNSTDSTSTIVSHDNDALKHSVQENVEAGINSYLEKHSSIWADRPNVRGSLFDWIYKARNTLLGIRANSPRHVLPLRYKINMQALKELLNNCYKDHVGVLLYIAPIKSDGSIPYDMTEYQNFKNEVSNIVFSYPGKIVYKNFEAIVPGPLWGQKESSNLIDKTEIDFMHFQFHGHEILADSLQAGLQQLISKQ